MTHFVHLTLVTLQEDRSVDPIRQRLVESPVAVKAASIATLKAERLSAGANIMPVVFIQCCEAGVVMSLNVKESMDVVVTMVEKAVQPEIIMLQQDGKES